MADLRLDTVNLALGEPNPYLRQGLRQAFNARGLGGVIDCHSMEKVEEGLTAGTLDVLVCDVELKGGDFCDSIHRMRHHKLGANPFVLVIGTIGSPDPALIRRVIDCGVDDLLLKPVSIEQVMERIKGFVRARKPFVVTHDYIGPDRRKAPRPGESHPTDLIEVPNTLRGKVVEGRSADDLQKQVQASAVGLNQHKMQRHAVQIGFLVRRILANVGQVEMGDIYNDDCRRLVEVTKDLSLRLRGTNYAHVAELAASLGGLAQRFCQEGFQPGDVDQELLNKLSMAVRRAFGADQDTAAVARMISDTVSRFAQDKTDGKD